MENGGIFHIRLVNFQAIWYILWHFGIFCGHSVHFPRFGILHQEKIWQPWFQYLHLTLLSKPSFERTKIHLSKSGKTESIGKFVNASVRLVEEKTKGDGKNVSETNVNDFGHMRLPQRWRFCVRITQYVHV
jgi:hypothetical protein